MATTRTRRTPISVIDTLLAIGTDGNHIGALANFAVFSGDLLALDTNIDNMGTGGGSNTDTGFAAACATTSWIRSSLPPRTNCIHPREPTPAATTCQVMIWPSKHLPFPRGTQQPLPRIGVVALRDRNTDDNTRN